MAPRKRALRDGLLGDRGGSCSPHIFDFPLGGFARLVLAMRSAHPKRWNEMSAKRLNEVRIGLRQSPIILTFIGCIMDGRIDGLID